MANEFKIKKGLIVDGDSTFSGSLESTQAVTASFFTGSFSGDGTNLTGITAEWDGTHDGDAEITGSLTVTGNIGVGVTSPAEKLEIDGNAKASNIYIADSIIHTDDTNTKIDFSTDSIAFDTAGSERMNISSTGKVSINGTEDELFTLNVTDNGPVYMSFERSNDRHAYLGFASSNDTFYIANEESAGVINISTAGGERMRIDSSGNVGIGQTSPTARLEVKGSGTTSATTALHVKNLSNTTLLEVTDDGLVTIPTALEHDGDAGTGLHFPSNDTISLKINGTEGLHINSGRNIGIGTTSIESGKKLHVVGDVKIEGDLDFRVINSSGFGQPQIELPNFIDAFWRADRRFTVSVTGGQSVAGITGLFDGTYANLVNFAASSTHVITINVANQSGVGVNGFTYPQGYIYFSFYSGTNDYDSISGRVKDKDGNYNSMTGLTDIISNDATYKVMRLTVPQNNYAVEYELTLVTNTNNVRLSAINYVSTRHVASQMELPYVAKTQDTNRLFGNIDVLTNTGGDQNRISGTGDSYLAVDTGDVGIGLTSPTAKLNVKGSGATSATDALLVENSAGTDLFKIEDGGNVGIGTTSATSKLNVDGGISTSGTSGDIDSSRSFILSTLGTGRGGIYSDQILTGDVADSLNDVVLYSVNGAIHLTEGSATNKVLTVSGSSVGIGTTSPDKELHVVGDVTITGGITGSSFTGSFVGDGSGLTGIGGGTPGGSATEVQFNDGGAFGGNSNFVFDDSNTRLAIGTTNLNHTLEVNGDFKIGASLIETYTATSLSTGANIVAALDYTAHSRVAMFVDYSVYDIVSSSTRAGRVMIASNGTNITSTDNSTADIGNTTGVTWSAAINSGNSTIEITLTVPGTGNWGTTTHITSL